MYTVKKFTKGQIISQVETGKGTITSQASRTVYGVIGPNGKVVVSTHPITNKVSQEIYPLKSTAQQVADWYNSQA